MYACSSRRQHQWLKQGILTELSPLLSLAYESADAPEYKAKVLKVVGTREFTIMRYILT